MTALPSPLTVTEWTSREDPAETATDEPAVQDGQALTLQGGRMSPREQVFAAVRYGFRAAWLRGREWSRREGGMIHGLLGAQPPSVLDQDEYAKSRAWVPIGHDGGITEGMGVVFHALIGRPGVAFGNLVSGIHARPFRYCVAAALIFAVFLITLAALGHYLAAALVGGALVVLVAAWASAGAIYVRLQSPSRQERRH